MPSSAVSQNGQIPRVSPIFTNFIYLRHVRLVFYSLFKFFEIILKFRVYQNLVAGHDAAKWDNLWTNCWAASIPTAVHWNFRFVLLHYVYSACCCVLGPENETAAEIFFPVFYISKHLQK